MILLLKNSPWDIGTWYITEHTTFLNMLYTTNPPASLKSEEAIDWLAPGRRSMFVVVGEKARDQVVLLHHMLSKAAVKARPSGIESLVHIYSFNEGGREFYYLPPYIFSPWITLQVFVLKWLFNLSSDLFSYCRYKIYKLYNSKSKCPSLFFPLNFSVMVLQEGARVH